MITVEDKLDIFYKLVYKEEEEKCIKEMEELEARNKALVEEKNKELQIKKEAFINRKIALANIQKNEMISKANEDKKANLLQEREKLLQDIIKSLGIKAKDFVQSNNYDAYFIDKVSKVINDLDENEIIITLNDEDNLRFQDSIVELQKKYKKTITTQISKSNIIGGFMLQDINRTYNLDYSFKTIIEENRYEIGKKLFSLLENAGDLNE